MCGRYTLATPADELVEAFDLPGLTFELFARYNIAPGQRAPVVAADRRGRRMGLMEWGLIPSWKNEPARALINARAESVATKPSFHEAFARRRCLVPADGFFEWKRNPDGAKVPYWIHPTETAPISFAAIWDVWTHLGAAPRHGFAIITTEANADVRPVHDRMPAVIAADDRVIWLSRSTSLSEARALLQPAPDGSFEARPVSRRVNRTAEDDAGLIDLSVP